MKGKSTLKKPVKRKKLTGRQLGKNGLTLKQEKFCHAYMETGNASEAYRRVYDCSKMKDTTIGRKAKELMDHGKISAFLQLEKEKLQEVSDIKKEKLLYVLESIHNAKITDYVEFDGKTVRFKAFDKLTDQQVRAIESIRQNEKGEIELKLHGKSWTTKLIADLHGYEAPKKVDVKATGGILYLPARDE